MKRFPRGQAWYQRLLRLYPTDFRDEFGGEMTWAGVGVVLGLLGALSGARAVRVDPTIAMRTE